MGHIDDSLLVGQSYNSCHRNIADTVSLFTNLGFITHPVKYVLQPQQKIDFLGFVLDSITMTVTLTAAKAMKVCLSKFAVSKKQPLYAVSLRS